MLTSARVVCLASAMLLGIASTASSQSSVGWAAGGTLGGLVVDQTDAALPGVEIVALNTNTGTRRATNSTRDGSFLMPLLPAGTYVVTAERDGFAPLEVRNVQLHQADYLVLRIRLRLGRIAQSVDVTAAPDGGRAPAAFLLPAAGRAEHGLKINGELQRALPLSRQRGFDDALLLTPGVVSDETGNHFVHGAGPETALVLVDGADVTSARQAGTALVQLSDEALADIEVKTAGMEPSVPLTQGAVLNVVTRSGSNVVHGASGLLWHPRGWMANTEPGGTSGARRVGQADLALGGPLQRDRWWAFGAYRWSGARFAASRSATTVALLQALVPGWTPEDLTAGGHFGLAKVTGRFGRHDVGAFYQRDVASETGPGGPAAGAFWRQVTGGNALAAHWATTWSDRLTTRLGVAYNDKTASTESTAADRTGVVVHAGVFASRGGLQGTGALAYLDSFPYAAVSQPANKLTVTAEGTWYRRTGVGTHEVQLGLSLQPRVRLAITQQYNNQGFTLEEAVLRDPANPSAGLIPFHRVVYDAAQSTQQDVQAHDAGVYVQDSWRLGRRLTVGAGLRVDWLRDRDRATQNVTRNSVAIGPRFSAGYELPSRAVVRGGWGRVHESAVVGRYSGPMPTVGMHDQYDVDLDGRFETDFYFPGTTHVSSLVQPDIHRSQPYVNEWTAGYRQPLGNQVTADVGLVRREFRAMPVIATAALYVDGVFQGYPNGPFDDLYTYTANRWSYPVVTDLTVQVTRQTARVQAVASYTRNWRHVAGTWVPGDPAAVIQPDAFANAAGIGSTAAVSNTDSLSGTSDTSAGAWVDHSVRVAVAYRASHGILLAGRYQVQSGVWSGPIVTKIATPDPQFGPAVVTQQGVPLANPLATTIRFAYPTRGEGQRQLPAVHEISVRVGHQLALGGGVRLETALDVFNPLNRAAFVTFAPTANQTYSPLFAQGSQRQPPRSLQASLRLVF